MASFPVPGDMNLRAIYRNPVTEPQVELSARRYVEEYTINGQILPINNVLFHMDYKLPDNCTYVDAGVRLGDNAGISYYELKERKRTAGERAIWAGVNAGLSLVTGNGLGDALFSAASSAATLENDFYYEERENSVLNEMSADTLSWYMYQNKPVNVEKYPPIYWDYAPLTPGQSGSLNALTPVNFIRKNDGNHFIYGIAWLRYKKSDGEIKTIYTTALPTTRDNIPEYAVKKSGW